MTVSYFGLNMILVLLIHLSFLDHTKASKSTGPYKASVVNVTNCDSPSRAYMKNSPIHATAQIYNNGDKTLLNGNITVLRDTKDVKYKVKGMVWANDKWNIINLRSELFECHSLPLHFVHQAMNVKYDRKNCVYLKGIYSVKDVDMNSILHFLMFNLDYGMMQWRYEMLKAETIICFNTFINIEAA